MENVKRLLQRRTTPLSNQYVSRTYNFWNRHNFSEDSRARLSGHKFLQRVLCNFAEFIYLAEPESWWCEIPEFIANRHPGYTVLTIVEKQRIVKIRCSQKMALIIQPLLEIDIGDQVWIEVSHEHMQSLTGMQQLAERIKDKKHDDKDAENIV